MLRRWSMLIALTGSFINSAQGAADYSRGGCAETRTSGVPLAKTHISSFFGIFKNCITAGDTDGFLRLLRSIDASLRLSVLKHKDAETMRTLMHIAAEYGQRELLVPLIIYGCPCDERDKDGKLAWELAPEEDREVSKRIIIEHRPSGKD